MSAWGLIGWVAISFAAGWLLRSIVADKQIRELDAVIDGLRVALARKERDG